MADRKISELVALTTPAAGDYLPIVDISEAAAVSKNKRITVEELLRGAPDGTAAAPSIAFESDGGNGLYLATTDTIGISTNGVSRATISTTAITSALPIALSGSTSGSVTLTPVAVAGTTTITLPATTGTVVTTGDTGTVTGTMIANGTIVDADVNASAAIAGTKISPNFGSQNVTTTGTTTAASFIPSSSTAPTNGVYLPAANAVGISTNSSERLRITSAGLVGIGTSSVYALLQVEGTQTATWSTSDGGTYSTQPYPTELAVINQQLATTNSFASIYFQGGKTTSNTGIRAARIAVLNDGTTYGSPIVFANRNASTGNMVEALRIDSSQRVGIGTTSPGAPLSVNGNAIIGPETGTRLAVNLTENDKVELQVIDSTSTARAMAFTVGATEAARIDSSGRLLVGTSSARTVGGVTGNFQVESTSSSYPTIVANRGDVGGAGIFLGKTRGTSVGSNTIVQADDQLGQLRFFGADGTGLVEGASIFAYVDGTPGANDMPGRLVLSTTADGAASPTERMRIDSSGRVGIGTTSPSGKLTVKTSSSNGAPNNWNDGQFVVSTGDTSTSLGIALSANSADNTCSLTSLSPTTSWRPLNYRASEHIFFRIDAATNEAARIDTSGRLLVGTSSTPAGAVALLQVQGYSGGSTGVGLLELKRGAAVPASGDELGRIDFSSSASERGAVITAVRDGGTWTTGSSYPGRLVFSTTADGASSPTEALRITNNRVICYNQPAPASYAAAATLTVADLKTGIIEYTGGAATLTLPTGTLTEGGFSGVYTNMTFEWSLINTGSGLATIGAGTNHTIVGLATCAQNNSARFATRRTAANTYVSYRIV